MKLPRKVTSGGRTFRVLRKKRVLVDRKPCRGSFDENTSTIEVEIGPEEMETLHHEVGHLVMLATKMDDWLVNCLGTHRAKLVEEEVCDRFVPALIRAIKENKL